MNLSNALTLDKLRVLLPLGMNPLIKCLVKHKRIDQNLLLINYMQEKCVQKLTYMEFCMFLEKKNLQIHCGLSRSISNNDINNRFLKFWPFQGIIPFILACFTDLYISRSVCLHIYLSINGQERSANVGHLPYWKAWWK